MPLGWHLGLPLPFSPGLLTHWKAPGQKQPRRKTANTVLKGKQMGGECAPSLSAQLGGKAQATSKTGHLLARERPSMRLTKCLLFQGQPATRVASQASS